MKLKNLSFICLLAIAVFLCSCESNDNPVIRGSSDLKPQSKVLLELFSNTSCAYCIYPSLYLDQIDSLKGVTINDTNVIIIRTHTTLFPNDPFFNYNPPIMLARQNYYDAGQFNPRAFLCGMEELPGFNSSVWTNIINQRLAQTNSFSIAFTNTFDTTAKSGSLNITVGQLSGAQVTDTRLFVAVTEGKMPYNAPNGERVFENILRDFISSPNGDAFSITPGQSVNFIKNYNLKSGINMNNAQIIVFVQGWSTKTVFGVEEKNLLNNTKK